jgi:hypothetical protein
MPEQKPDLVTNMGRATVIVLRQARKLHRAASTGTLRESMPALRRLHTAAVLPGLTLRALHETRHDLKRKHFLRALAIEAGYPDWELFRAVLDNLPEAAVQQFRVMDDQLMFLNLWFSDEEQALAYVRVYGGTSIRVGKQAVVISPDSVDPTRAAGRPHATSGARHVA